MVSEDGRCNLSPGENSDVDNLPKDVDDDKYWKFDGAKGGESTEIVDMKRKLLDLWDGCQTKKRRVPTNVAEAVEIAQELLRLADVSVNTMLLSKVPFTTERGRYH